MLKLDNLHVLLVSYSQQLYLSAPLCSFSNYIFSFLVPFSAKLIDGINRSDSRRRALIFFCFEYFNALARVSDSLISSQIAMLHSILL